MRYFLFTHVHFDISYNENRVIEINVSTDPLRTVEITDQDSATVEFSYSTKWKPTSIPFERRMEKYSRYSFLPQHLEIHWFSIINSCVTVLLLTGAWSWKIILGLVCIRQRVSSCVDEFSRRILGNDSNACPEKRLHQVH